MKPPSAPLRLAASAVLLAGTLLVADACRSASRVRHIIRNVGSDTMVNVAQAWAERYAQVEPSVSVEVSGGGSATGIAALIDGSADLANASRSIEPEEEQAALAKIGKKPVEWVAGYDALAVYVHRDNPLDSISLEQLGQIYGREGNVTRWSHLGIDLPGEIILISRQSNSGTYEYFRQSILGSMGEFRLGTRDLNGSKEVVTLIGHTPGAMGYSGMGYAIPGVKMLRISRKPGEPAFAPSIENVRSKSYPIARPLFLYSLGQPDGATRDYLRWILSPDGQERVERSGYVPLQL